MVLQLLVLRQGISNNSAEAAAGISAYRPSYPPLSVVLCKSNSRSPKIGESYERRRV